MADDRDGLMTIVERLLARLQTDEDPERVKILKVVSGGWYSPNYLLERLPAEIARTEQSGRSFCIGMLRLHDDGTPVPAWRQYVCQRLDPVEVAVASDDEALIILYPESDLRSAGRRQLSMLQDLVSDAPSEAPFPIRLMLSALTCYDPSGADGAMLKTQGQRLLAELEANLSPIDLDAADVFQDDDDPDEPLRAQQDTSDESTREDNDNDIYLPVAVGFAAGRRMPVSVWYDGELHLIDAVIGERKLEPEKRCLDVQTRRGTYRLLEQDGRWYIRLDGGTS